MNAPRSNVYKKYIDKSPLHQFLGVKVESIEEGISRISIPINSHTLNTAGSLHGGVIYLVSDVAALAALGPCLNEDEFAVTIDIQCSVYKGTTNGTVIFQGCVAKRTRRLAFINVEVINGKGDLVAETRVTKAITHHVPEILKS